MQAAVLICIKPVIAVYSTSKWLLIAQSGVTHPKIIGLQEGWLVTIL